MKFSTLVLIESIINEINIEAFGFKLEECGITQLQISEELSVLTDEVFNALKKRPFCQIVFTGDTRKYPLKPRFFVDHKFKEWIKKRELDQIKEQVAKQFNTHFSPDKVED